MLRSPRAATDGTAIKYVPNPASKVVGSAGLNIDAGAAGAGCAGVVDEAGAVPGVTGGVGGGAACGDT